MKSYERLLDSIGDIEEYCLATPKYSDMLSTLSTLRGDIEMCKITQWNAEHAGRRDKEDE